MLGVRVGPDRRAALPAGDAAGGADGGAAGAGPEGHGALHYTRRARARSSGAQPRVGAVRGAETRPLHLLRPSPCARWYVSSYYYFFLLR